MQKHDHYFCHSKLHVCSKNLSPSLLFSCFHRLILENFRIQCARKFPLFLDLLFIEKKFGSRLPGNLRLL